MTDAEIKSVIFDLGKVVFDYSFGRTYQYWATVSKREAADIKSKFKFDQPFQDFESGKINPSTFRNLINKQLDLSLSDTDFDNGWCNLYLDTYEGVEEILVALKRNYKLVALTNTNIIHSPIWRSKYSDTLKHFEKIFASYELGTRKPERKSFEIVLDYLQARPDEVIFLDDNIENINGAKELGIHTILVSSTTQLKEGLQKEGLLT